MYGIFLTQNDKKVLASVLEDSMKVDVLPQELLMPTLEYLQSKGLVEIQFFHGEFRTARLTSFGRKFKIENPRLKSEMTESKKWRITTAVAVVAILVALIANLRI